ncbi:hypothetical protein ACTGUT_12045, partial [Streptococcus suis]
METIGWQLDDSDCPYLAKLTQWQSLDFGKMKTNSNFKNTFYIRDEQGKAKSQNCWLHSLENKCRIC